MRIIGQIPHPVAKVTVFQANMKFSVKVEAGLMEQTFKLRESDVISGMKDITRMIDERFIDQCLARFADMSRDLGEAYHRNFHS